MRVCAVVGGLGACVVSSAACAETWKASMVFVSGTQGCQATQPVEFTYTLEGTTLSLASTAGTMTKATVLPTGEVSQDFKSASGSKLRLVGNVKTRDLALLNPEYGCRWNTSPK